MLGENDEFDSKKSEKRKTRTRVREVDFMRVEDAASGQELAPFELEVKNELASAKSPFEELVSREKGGREAHLKRIPKYKLACLIRKAKLTPLQVECYRLIWVKGLSDNQTAKKLGFSRSRVRNIKRFILKVLPLTIGKEKNRKLIASKARIACKTEKQRTIWELYFKRGKTISEIAGILSLSRQAVHQVLRRFFPTV